MIIYIVFVCVQIVIVFSTNACIDVQGQVHCHQDNSKHQNVTIEVYDQDGYGSFFLQLFDADDLIGANSTDEHGHYSIYACSNEKHPDPYIVIKHACNGNNETITLPVFESFVPNFWYTFTILDDKDQVMINSAEPSENLTFVPHK